MIGVVDYGAGNLQSVANALDRLDQPYLVCDTPRAIERVDRVVLPGVGHFGAAARALAGNGVGEALRGAADAGKPLLGICLGMQLFLEGSDEAPDSPGLGLLPGRCARLQTRHVPHMGWNRVRWRERRNERDDHYYFAHSYVAAPRDPHVLATVEIEDDEIPVAIGREGILGVQFHPEKSGECGLALLEGFARC